MVSRYEESKETLLREPHRWLITGVAGFIGSNLLEALLKLRQRVVGLDNFSTGRKENLEQVRTLVGADAWNKFQFVEGDLTDARVCASMCRGIDLILHQAALGSVPLSLAHPLRCHESNVTGFLNLLIAAREAGIRKFVFASSSAVYGDDPRLPKVEDVIGKPLSPYAASKLIDEIYAQSFAQAFGVQTIGLRYFNVFGPRQDPQGAYAAVIPKWISALLHDKPVYINGDGETTRDFCFIENVVQANLLAATVQDATADNQIFNIGTGETTTLKQLHSILKHILRTRRPSIARQEPLYRDFRAGDVRHSQADISKAQRLLGYSPTYGIEAGLSLAMEWYYQHLR